MSEHRRERKRYNRRKEKDGERNLASERTDKPAAMRDRWETWKAEMEAAREAGGFYYRWRII